MIEKIDLAITGAGIHGLACARTYIELHPFANVVVFDAQESIGGVWSKQRLYPTLKSNNMLGTYEYSDFPMDEDLQQAFGVKPGDHIPGAMLHQYLTRYAKKFGVYSRIRFNTTVEMVEEIEGEGWRLFVQSGENKQEIITEKLVIATGLHSQPFMPKFEGANAFKAPLFHAKEFCARADLRKTSENVVVLGGTKSAWDIAYAFADQGVQVHMVMRESGHGPMWLCPAYVTPLKKRLETMVTRRAFSWMSPCIYGAADGYAGVRNFLHGTGIGRMLVNTFWGILGNDVVTLNGYDKHEETKKLKPWSNPFFMGSGLSILNYEKDFFQLVRDGIIKIHIADITSLSDHTVHLSSGEQLKADALICSTGWKHRPPINFLPSGSEASLGLPYHSDQPIPHVAGIDRKILSQFPRLKDQSKPNPDFKPTSTDPTDKWAPANLNQPYKLYRFMVPPAHLHTRTIAFSGFCANLVTTLQAQTQALWLSAYFDGKLDIPDDDAAVEYETLLYSRFGKWRNPEGTSHGSEYPDAVIDSMPYLDLLLGQLGLRVHRKGGMFREWFEPYMPGDYKGLIEEWKDVQGRHDLK